MKWAKRKPLVVLVLASAVLVFSVVALLATIRTIRAPQRIPSTAATPRLATTTPITHGDQTKKQIIFTFDGGDGAQSGEAILTALKKHHIRGTFFLTGKFVEANPELVKNIVMGGNEIFNHTYDHPDLTSRSDDQITQELDKMAASLESAAGISPKPYFRPPYGAQNARVRAAAAADGYTTVMWTIDAHDWMEPKGVTATEVRGRILETLAPGNIYLMHVGDSITGEILDDVFSEIEARGYTLVALTQGL